MRSDLDAIRERQVIRETMGELQSRSAPWRASEPELYVAVRRPERVASATQEERERMLAMRPGTALGGF
jgi:hypothetical protein